MFYFICNESNIYESFTFWNKFQDKMNFLTTFKFIEMHLYAFLRLTLIMLTSSLSL